MEVPEKCSHCGSSRIDIEPGGECHFASARYACGRYLNLHSDETTYWHAPSKACEIIADLHAQLAKAQKRIADLNGQLADAHIELRVARMDEHRQNPDA